MLIHTERLSLGTPGPVDEAELGRLVSVVAEVQPLWVSDHLGFRRSDEIDLGWPNPIPLNRETLKLVADHARQVIDACGVPLLLENLASQVAILGSIPEPEFLNEVCEAADCGVLLDVTALFVSSRTHRFDPMRWLARIEADRIAQLHVGGCEYSNGVWLDTHADPICEEVWDLLTEVMKIAPLEAVILERDARFSQVLELEGELQRLRLAADCSTTQKLATDQY